MEDHRMSVLITFINCVVILCMFIYNKERWEELQALKSQIRDFWRFQDQAADSISKILQSQRALERYLSIEMVDPKNFSPEYKKKKD